MKILGILGSSRAGGNTEILLDIALDKARSQGLETTKILFTTSSFITAEVLFYTGGFLLGKEMFCNYKSYLKPKNWTKRSRKFGSESDKDSPC